jgi:hypothetical protein
VLSVAFAVGLRRVLGPAPTVGPLLIAVYGVGLIVTGAFVGDPGLGFPPGTGPGIGELSWHAAVHAAAPPVAFGALIGACLVFARRFVGCGRRGWAGYSAGTAVTALALLLWPGDGGGAHRRCRGDHLGMVDGHRGRRPHRAQPSGPRSAAPITG